MLTAREPSVKPLADVVRCYICCDGQHKSGNTRHLSHLPSRINGRARPQNHYTTLFAKKIQETMRPSPLSRAYARQLPQRGSHWHVGQLSSGRAKHNISEAAVLRCLGQRQLDKERCPEAAVPASKARPLASCRASGVQWKVIRPAKASPFGRGGIAKQ